MSFLLQASRRLCACAASRAGSCSAALIACCVVSTAPVFLPADESNPAAADQKAKPAADERADAPPHHNETIRGRVVWLADALARRFDVTTVPEASERSLVLETPNGELHPIIEDIRGRAFRRDERLRNIDLELLVRRYEGAPLAQVIRVFAIENNGKYELDYWCEICAIAMYELKACDCCQGPIELRRRKVEEGGE